jgi:hypothetical protein
MRVGDTGLTPMALAVSRIDRLAWNSIISTGSSSTLNTLNNASGARTNMITAFWDSLLAELRCSNYAFKAAESPSGIDAN